MTKSLLACLAGLFIFQLLIAAGFELAHDEAYYWLFSRHLDWGFFDHPPFVAVIIKLFSFLPHAEWSLRIGFIGLQFASLLLIMRLVKAKWTAMLLFFAFPLASFTGLLGLPDIPLLFMAAVYMVLLKHYLERDSIVNSSLLGLSIALLFYAKYHGVLLVFFTIIAIPKLFLRKSFYVVALVALAGFFPHMWWQYQHEFATLRYHFLERPAAKFSLARSFEFVGLQIVLAGVLAGPVVWWIVAKNKTQNAFNRSMKFISVGSVIFFLISSFSKRVEANWTIYLAAPLIYLVADSSLWKKKVPKYLLVSSFTIVLLARVLFVVSPEVVSIKRLKEFHGWKTWAHEISERCEGLPLLANSYQIASKLSYYLQQEVSALNYHSRKNQFDYWRLDKEIPTNQVCYITDVRDLSGEEITTPEGKTLKIVKNQGLKELWALKSNEGNR